MKASTDPKSLTPKLPPQKLFIDGQYVDTLEGGTLPVINPATGDKLFDAPAASAKDVDRAVKAARKALESGPWGKMAPGQRGRLIGKFADLLWERREEFALIESLNNGKTFKAAIRGDVGAGATTIAYYADWADKISGEIYPVAGDFLTYGLREPIGVVGAIVPWNYPTCQAAWKLGPALAAGCTVVLKPSELTPLSALKLGELAQLAGFPEGVLNVVTGLGDPTGEAIARHPDIDKVSFTGSVRTARRLMIAAAETNLKKLSCELGGKSPQIILPDADFEQAIEACFWGIFSNKGEMCNAGSRVLVHDAIYDKFVAMLVERCKKMVVGDPLDAKTEMGSQISQTQLKSILGYIASGKEQGANLLVGGERDTEGSKAKGLFVKPTVFGDVQPTMKIANEEIFGPVLACMRVRDEAHAIEVANGTTYGLAAAIWSRDVAKAHAMAKKIKSGVVWINCFNEFDDAAPFGGYKESGWGKSLSVHALENYLQTKAIWTKLPEN
jgi:aldehyde dehydrogenase (NAD+)